MSKIAVATLAAVTMGFSVPCVAAVHFTLGLDIAGDGEISAVAYDCGVGGSLAVSYLNAAPNFLAILPIDGEDLVFVSTITASGAKYESGSYVWWTKGADATLSDIKEGLDAAPLLTCAEVIDTP